MSENGDGSKEELAAEVKAIMKEKPKKAKFRALAVFLAILAVIILFPFGAKFVANKYTDKKFTELLDSFKGPCYAIYEKSEYDIMTRRLKVTGMSVICGEEEAARFGLVDFGRIVSGSPLPANLSAEFSDGTINADAKIFGRYGLLAEKLGYGPIPVSGSVIFTLGPVSKTFKMEKFSLKAETVGLIEAEFRVDGVNAASPAGALKQIISNDYSDMWISFTNGGFAEKVMARYAAAVNSGEDTAKARALHGIERRISGKYKNDARTRDQLVQIYRFIESPSRVVIKSDGGEKASILSTLESADYGGWRSLLRSVEKFPLKLYSN